ncbi:uncharacterized protein LOC125179585 [Hyalella azteca]|uniref:Uncharacterized protein LOC125179585 n=1 Tax=Hyalella azteca TaxID=294128 RepID=A0A979FWM1_HYAAZ|nr:uncharacterized protein LOC125179585 [Hyalella azteca]
MPGHLQSSWNSLIVLFRCLKVPGHLQSSWNSLIILFWCLKVPGHLQSHWKSLIILFRCLKVPGHLQSSWNSLIILFRCLKVPGHLQSSWNSLRHLEAPEQDNELAINPILYNALSVKFRRAFKKMLCCGSGPEVGRTVTVLYSDGTRRLNKTNSRSQIEIHQTTTTVTSAYTFNTQHLHHPYIHHYNPHHHSRTSAGFNKPYDDGNIRDHSFKQRGSRNGRFQVKKRFSSHDALRFESNEDTGTRYEGKSAVKYQEESNKRYDKEIIDSSRQRESPLKYVDDSPEAACPGDCYELGAMSYFSTSAAQSPQTPQRPHSLGSLTSLSRRTKDCDIEVVHLDDCNSVSLQQN